jgi:phosphoglycerate kinase
MITVNHIDFKNKKALIRVDYNVPLNENFEITDTTRIDATKKTIETILNNGGSVVLMSHLGRPKEGPTNKYSLVHLVKYLSGFFNKEILFASDCISEEAFEMSRNLKSGEILLLENLRFYKEEEKGDEAFAQKLSAHGNVYVNDAFGTAHRAHASTAVIAKYFGQKCFGFVMGAEVESANKVMKTAEKPFTAIMGGAKVSDKILIIENLLDVANNIIIGGGMSFTFFKAMGYNIGNSLCENDKLHLALEILEKAKQKNVTIVLPVDVVLASEFSNNADTQIADVQSISENWMGLDVGPKSELLFKEVILNSKTILWNGPMGVFEMDKFQQGTKNIAQSVAQATQNGSYSLIGGGDSVAAINKYNLAHKVSYVSTGGGALLEFMEGKVLPGIAAIV